MMKTQNRWWVAPGCLVAVVLLGAAAGDVRAQEAARPGSIVIYTKANAPAAPRVEDLEFVERVTRNSITWTFDKPARAGRFVTGDWYVVGPVTVKAIDPKPLWGQEVGELVNQSAVKENDYPGKQARNGSSLNPPSKSGRAGFDSRIPSGRYNPDYFTPLPIAMKPGDSLVSTISRANSELTKFSGQHVDPLRAAEVLTCVAAPLPPDAFRPSYCASANSPLRLARDLQRERLLSLPRADKAPASLAGVAARFEKPWLDLADFGFAAPVDNLPHYGQNMAQIEGEASLLLLMDYPAEEKEPLLIGLVQVGIDLHGVARGGFTWRAHGGLYSGRKWPMVFAGVMLGDADLQSPAKKLPHVIFAEDDQTAFGPIEYRGKTYERSFSGARVIFRGHSPKYWGDAGHHEKGWGLLDVFPPAEWPKRADGGKVLASEGYRRANTSSAWVAEALAARIMHAEPTWGHDAFFAYVDRWMTEDDTKLNEAMKAAGWADYTAARPGRDGRQGSVTGAVDFVKSAWARYRNNLPPAADGSKTPPAEQTWK